MRVPIISHNKSMCMHMLFPHLKEECVLLVGLEQIHFIDSMRMIVAILTVNIKLVSLYSYKIYCSK